MSEFETLLEDLRLGRRGELTVEAMKDLILPYIASKRIRAPRIRADQRIYRGRITDKATHVSDLTYPPAVHAKLGRANRAGSPIFYGSTAPWGPFVELLPGPDEVIMLSEWRLRTHALFNTLGYHQTVLEAMGSKYTTELFANDKSPFSGVEASEPFFRPLAKLFTTRQHDEAIYRVTVAAAECMLQGPFVGLLYPAVAGAGNFHNLAIPAASADVLLELVRAERIRVLDPSKSKYHLEALARPLSDGTLAWEPGRKIAPGSRS